jgi:hypothetical protein
LRDAISTVTQLHRITVRVDDDSFKHVHSIVRAAHSPTLPAFRVTCITRSAPRSTRTTQS